MGGINRIFMDTASQRNKAWSRDELILALDVYFDIKPATPLPQNPDVVGLSKFLRTIAFRESEKISDNFRSPASIVMKLMNFRNFDPNYKGKGLSSVGRTDRTVWNEFSADPTSLKRLGNAIRAGYRLFSSAKERAELDDEIEEAMEGNILTRIHISRERNPRLVRAKKNKVLREIGSLSCEVCGFNFERKYGARGQGYIECHHIRPLHTVMRRTSTRLADLAVVCANCHRMLHSSRPWPTISQLRSELVSEN